MWNYNEIDAYPSISLHDCRTDSIRIDGNDLIVSFPDGFWITPASPHIDGDDLLKTGPAELCFHQIGTISIIDSVDLFKTTHLMGRPIFCRRTQPEPFNFLKMFNSGKYELEFISEYHAPLSVLYKCWLWKKDVGMMAECELELNTKSIEYRWDQICKDRKW